MQQIKQSSDYTANVRVKARPNTHTYPWPRINLLALVMLAVLAIAAIWFYRQGPSEKASPPIGLHPAVAQASDKLVAETSKLGIEVVITDGFRSSAEQDALYRQGREDSGAIVTQV